MNFLLHSLLICGLFLFGCAEPVPPEADLPEDPPISNPVTNLRLLALGDSYTIGESVPESERWPVLLAASLETEGYGFETVEIIARTGWRTDNLMDAIDGSDLQADYDLVGLLIGVNNQFQGRSIEEYETEFAELLQTAVLQARGNRDHVIVLSIPDYGFTPFGAPNQTQISAAIDAFNAVNKTLTEQAGIRYFDITPISRRGLDEPALVAPDGLHPSGAQYAEWVQAIDQDVALLLQ
ncbi:MAG: SGNH/GDSL hydrolase family protein [Bacteroidota bacterium]